MGKNVRVLSIALSAAIALTVAVPARAASWLEMNFYLFGGPRYDAWLPACDNPLALAKINVHFAIKEIRFWNPSLFISRFGETREVAYRPWGDYAIPRRFCVAKTLLSDGTETVLHSFAGSDGSFPMCNLMMDKKGNLYGTTNGGGAHGAGAVFKVSAKGTLTVLYSFAGGSDGSFPQASVTRDSAGNLYGTTSSGGASGDGTVFMVAP